MNYKFANCPTWLKFLGVILLAIAFAYFNTNMIALGFDWAYDLIAAIAGQNQELNQGLMSINALRFAGFPLGIGVYIAFAEIFLERKSTKLWLGITLALCTLPVFFDMWLEFRSIHVQDIVFQQIPCVLAIGTLSFLLTRRLIARVATFADPMIMLKASLIYLVPNAIATFLNMTDLIDLERGYLEELFAYAILLFATGAVALKKTKPKNKIELLLICLLATIPLAYANVLNVAGNLLSISLDTIHMGANLSGQALFSSLLISIVYVLTLSLACLAFEEYIHRISDS